MIYAVGGARFQPPPKSADGATAHPPDLPCKLICAIQLNVLIQSGCWLIGEEKL